jgi:hypothetical protein
LAVPSRIDRSAALSSRTLRGAVLFAGSAMELSIYILNRSRRSLCRRRRPPNNILERRWVKGIHNVRGN